MGPSDFTRRSPLIVLSQLAAGLALVALIRLVVWLFR